MSEMAKKARAAMKAKAKSLAAAGPEKVDSSTWSPSEPINAEVKTGMRPISRRAYKKGGKVVGAKAAVNIGRKPRKSGGSALTANSMINRDAKEANEERPGGKAHIGGYKKGGRIKKQVAGSVTGDTEAPVAADSINELLARNPGPSTAPVDTTPRSAPNAPENQKISPAMAAKMRAAAAAAARASTRKAGGRTKKAAGGPQVGASKMMQDAKATSGVPSSILNSAPTSSRFAKSVGMKKGGGAKHDDAKMDAALIKKMVKPSARTKKEDGGGLSGVLGGLLTSNILKGDSPLSTKGMIDMLSPKKNGGRAARKAGGGVFTGPSYPGKVPGATGGRTAKYGGGALGGMPGMQNTGGAMPSFNTPPAMGMGSPTQMGGPSPMGAPMNPMGLKSGGRAKGKGKTNINIVIAGGRKPEGGEPMMPPPGLGKPPGGIPISVPPPGGMPGGMPIGAAPPMPMPAGPPPGMPMPRKAGGKVYRSYKDMDAGAGGGLGRLEKTEIQARK